jgi:hypothetical protein
VVNNGGFVHFGTEGKPGVLQVLDTANLDADLDGDGLPGTTLPIATAAICDGLPRPDPGCDPTGVYSLDGDSGWLTTFPDDVLRAIDLAALSLGAPDFSAPRVTGPFFPATLPAPALYAGRGGFGHARLGELDATLGALLGDHDLQAGNGPVTCAEYDTP